MFGYMKNRSLLSSKLKVRKYRIPLTISFIKYDRVPSPTITVFIWTMSLCFPLPHIAYQKEEGLVNFEREGVRETWLRGHNWRDNEIGSYKRIRWINFGKVTTFQKVMSPISHGFLLKKKIHIKLKWHERIRDSYSQAAPPIINKLCLWHSPWQL